MITLFLLLMSSVALANDTIIEAVVESVYDGDTINVSSNIWPGLLISSSIRIKGIDTPEIKTIKLCEKALGLQAKDILEDFVTKNGNTVYLSNVGNDKYGGRFVADVYFDLSKTQSVKTIMIDSGLAVPYSGGSKTYKWCK